MSYKMLARLQYHHAIWKAGKTMKIGMKGNPLTGRTLSPLSIPFTGARLSNTWSYFALSWAWKTTNIENHYIPCSSLLFFSVDLKYFFFYVLSKNKYYCRYPNPNSVELICMVSSCHTPSFSVLSPFEIN